MLSDQIEFRIDERVLGLGLTGVYFVMSGLSVRDSDPIFDALMAARLEVVQTQLDPAFDFKTDRVLAGFRDLHTRVGRSNRDNVASPENLLRMLMRHGGLPRVNLLVDIYNLVSVETHLALGAHDLARTDGNISLRFTTGSERFVPLGSESPKQVHAGEYAYIDDSEDIICRLETRQVEKTKVTLETTDCFFIVQGNSETDSRSVWDGANELISLVTRFCGGKERILYGP